MATSIEELKKYAGEKEVALPGFVPGENFNAVLRRPSLMKLAQEGKIPNQLLGAASSLFREGVSGLMKDGEKFRELCDAVIYLAKASLVEPTYSELEENGIELTDLQLIAIYSYTQEGVAMLEGFRKGEGTKPDSESGDSEE